MSRYFSPNKKCPDTTAIGDSRYNVSPGSYKVYQTHDNGGRTFRVFIDKKNKIAVITSMIHTQDCYPYMINKMFSFEQVWIGKSPRNDMTEYYNTYGPKFEGNTILFHIGNRKYMYVGESVKLFQTQSPIVHYVSPVGNNDVPYPYAVDDAGVYYLLSLGTGLKIKSKMMMEYDNPYELYYEEQEKKKKSFAVKPITFDVVVPRQ